ncbi:MAG: polysaccharide biosynthesis/export family protein [Acidobacteriaceae bacterium]|jgi:polysaccharide export outer membrane protein
MNTFRCIVTSICLLPALGIGLAQPTPGKPVLSAEPTEPATPPPAPSVMPDAGSLPLSPNYVIGADDSLKIEVWGNTELSTTLPVRPDGMITLPDIGDIPAAGRTPMELAAEITTRVKKLVIDPTVTVTVLAVNSKRIYMVGEVAHVGPLAIAPGMTVLQAIASAGGLTAYANKKKIYIWRGEPGKQIKIPFDYNKAVKKGDMQGVSLLPGDTIVVP